MSSILRYVITALLTSVFLCPNAAGQSKAGNNYDIDVISSSHGLPSDDVKDVYQDSKGFLWFCTTEGLIRYDGYVLKTYSIAHHHNKGLITNSFNAIREDSEGYLWCATDRGVARLNREDETFTFFNSQSPAPYTLSYDVINALAIDDRDHIWIGSSGAGVDILAPGKGIVEQYSIAEGEAGMNSDWITHLFRDKRGNIWISSWQGALTLISRERDIIKSWSIEDIPLNLTHFSPFSMTQGGENEYWLGLWEEGIINFSLEGDSIVIQKHLELGDPSASIASNIIFDLTFDKDSNLWVGTPTGLTKIRNPKQQSPAYMQFNAESRDKKLSHNEAYAILCDASGLIWAGTSGGGVNKIDNKIKLFNTYTIGDASVSPGSQSVSAFVKTIDGKLLVGVKSLGFGEYNPEDQTFTRYTRLPVFDRLPGDINTVNCFHRDSKGYLWLGTRYQGVIKLNTETGEYIIINKNTPQYDFPSREISDIREDPFGHIWIGTENGLYKVVPSEPESFSSFIIIRYNVEDDNPSSLSSNRISQILIDTNNNLWAATYDGGINRSASNIENHYPLQFERYLATRNDRNGLITDHILTLFEDASGTIWIGSGGGGLFRWAPGKEEFISYAPHVSGDIIYTINQDKKNNLWIGTNRGLTRMATTGDSIASNYFLRENGLQGNIFNKGATFRDVEGNLYFGGNRGFNIFTPGDINPDSFIPPVVITHVKVMNEPASIVTGPDHPLVLNHLKNNFSVTFAALSFSQPENNKYSVRLEGLEEDWRILDADMRTLNYANLKPGEYTLKIKGSNSQGHWNPRPEQLFIRVKPAPYKTWWAFSIYALIFGGIILLVFRMERKNQQVRHALEIEHIERQKSDKLNFFKQGLFANISHEFLTPLSILSCLIDDWRHSRGTPNSKDLSLAERNINRLNRLNRQFLYFSKSEIEQLPLHVSAGNLNRFTQNICDNFTPLARKNRIFFNCEINCPESNLWFDQEKLDIILYNLLSNAFKFTPKEGSVTLELSLAKSGNRTMARFEITDTGKGISKEKQSLIFDRYQSIDGSNHQTGGFGIGLSLTKSMVEAHKGTIELDSEPGRGTTVVFSIPVNRNAFNEYEVGENRHEQIPTTFMEPEDIEEETILRIKNLQQSFDNKPVVLIVEDNSDFRKLLKSNLEPVFTVIEAPNGVIGYETALNKKPNIIISDVLMPSMNGIELTRKIRKNEATSHINIILLTAKISDEERAEGYRAGADSYIAKPFNLNTLLARMEALLEQQKRTMTLMKRFNHAAKNGHAAQDDFLVKAGEIIGNNLSNPDFSVKMLAEELSMSNSMLYRKTSELLNINPNTFIRKMRMMKAAEMLEENHLSISEVAYRCGFKDVSYFGVTFKKDYGMTPSQYQKKRSG
ncbi:hybrid sensor histidine kinase/response regulator transcription factor [Anaerophaga thermohalophila]|uniref:hybrid sensor histidine kinase/response regulator transcription factor n=1 Tax=Anaerophaga thermohalophila TaxID=177400 RepID=UPI0002E572E9|nr:two-component regulator propeller domain-containing protein [Anaerophaga thermohalophila]